MIKFITLTLLIIGSTAVNADALFDAINSESRSADQRLRDEYRNPQQTLRFFDVKADMKVAEISPGGGWYTNILAPLLKDKGELYAAHFFIDENTRDFFRNSREKFENRVKNEESFSNIVVTTFDAGKKFPVAPDNSLDRVLTFRNVHNWYMRHGDEGVENALQIFFNALKKGGMLGVVEHRLPEDRPLSEQQSSGYMKQSYVLKAAEAVGFQLVAASEINGNPLDTADHPKGVWTLPPRLRLGDQNKDRYLNIGESDRMTLKFIKPE